MKGINSTMAHYKGAATEATRAMNIMKKREKAKEELELKKKKFEEDLKLGTIDDKFSTHHDAIENQLRSSTVGLVTLDQMRERQIDAVREREKQLARKEEGESSLLESHKQTKSGKTNKSKTLSFGYDSDESDVDSDDNKSIDEEITQKDAIETKCTGEPYSERNDVPSERVDESSCDNIDSMPRKKTKLATSVDTSLLPDREREEEERILREKLAAEWRERQRKLKEEEIEITFSYWDGSGHRKVVRMKKGNSIYQFLHACLETLRKDFNELRSVSADQLMYVKEDLIIPHHYTFYDFIVTKARGKSGPLFSFDVHEDVRLIVDATVEKDESHAGKVLLRRWYERNKHIFPASRWEPYDPTRTYEKYTISDKRSK